MAVRLSPGAAALLLSMLTSGASAVEVRDAPPPFTGPYIGIAAGFDSRKVKVDNQTIGASFSDSETGGTFGGYVGYNWQPWCKGLVVGVETDFNFLGGSPTAFDIEIGPTGLRETTALTSDMNWYGTLRGRLGFTVHDDFLIYATGGLAYASVKHTLNDDCVGCGNSTFNFGPFSQSNKDTRAGWTAGGGGEYLHSEHWLFRGEALYVDLGSETHSYFLQAPGGTAEAVAKWDDHFWVGRIGAAYLFNWPN